VLAAKNQLTNVYGITSSTHLALADYNNHAYKLHKISAQTLPTKGLTIRIRIIIALVMVTCMARRFKSTISWVEAGCWYSESFVWDPRAASEAAMRLVVRRSSGLGSGLENSNRFFEKFRKKFYYQKKILKHFEHGKATMESNFGLLLCPKSIKNGQIITDLAKTVHFGKYYFNKL
jgi:hypothetical protein